MEKWKEVYGYDALYEISNLGRIRTKHHGKEGYKKEYRYLEPIDNGNGYLRVNLRSNHRQRTAYIHKLVAQAFVDNPNGYSEINHIDEDKSNNNADNLEWCSHLYNCQYGTKNIRASEKRKKKIECVELGIIFDSLNDAANYFDVGVSAIGNCLKGRSKSCAGYTWRYAGV